MSEKNTNGKPSRITIRVNGKDYPCYPTMGAAVGFNELTGRNIENMKGTSDFSKYIYCCARSASRREHVDFNMSLEDFCDGVLIEDLNAFNAQTVETNGESDSKKKD